MGDDAYRTLRIQCVMVVLFPGGEADHSPPTSAEVKKAWMYTPLPYTPSLRD
jgi:hypothetical protein